MKHPVIITLFYIVRTKDTAEQKLIGRRGHTAHPQAAQADYSKHTGNGKVVPVPKHHTIKV
jgi:hypothetical protein